jgi:organic radical activating enzyme
MKFKISELFYSAQGEGRFVGVPSVFMRTFGCNFKCEGFGCKTGEVSTERSHLWFAELPSHSCQAFLSLVIEFRVDLA